MKTIVVSIQTNIVGSRCEDEFEIEDNATDEEIEDAAKDIVWNMAEWNWRVKS